MRNSRRTAKTAKASPRGKPFAPGQSGNPSGRPRSIITNSQVRDYARSKSMQAIETLAKIGALDIESADGTTLNAILRANESILTESRRAVIIEENSKIDNIEDLISHGVSMLREQMQHISSPQEFAALLRAARDLLNEDRQLNEEARSLSDEEITKRLEANNDR